MNSYRRKRKKQRIKIEQYFVTIIATMIVVFSFALISQIELLYRCEHKILYSANGMQIIQTETIDELEKEIQKNPNNYIPYIKLARKYNQIKEYNSANSYYQNALKVSERNNYTLYMYAKFCIERALVSTAVNLAEEIDLDSKKAIKYKTELYEKIADALDSQGEFEGAIKAYQIANKYANSAYSRSKKQKLISKYAFEYLKLADVKIKKQKVEEAKLDIYNSLKIKDTPLAKYKLALIYKDFDTVQAEKLFLEVMNENPYIINPYIYSAFLNKLIEDNHSINKSESANYYTNKLKSYKQKLSSIYVYKGDIEIRKLQIFASKKIFSKQNTYFLKFDFKNNTNYVLEDLTLLVEVYYGNDKFESKQKVITNSNPLNPYATYYNYEIKLPSKFNDDIFVSNKNIILKFYAKKQKKAPWTLIKIQQLK